MSTETLERAEESLTNADAMAKASLDKIAHSEAEVAEKVQVAGHGVEAVDAAKAQAAAEVTEMHNFNATNRAEVEQTTAEVKNMINCASQEAVMRRPGWIWLLVGVLVAGLLVLPAAPSHAWRRHIDSA